MEALAAVGLVGNIIQFLQLGAQVVCTTKEIGSSAKGLTKDASDLANLTEGLQKVCSDLVAKAGNLPRSSGSLEALAGDCIESAQQLIDALISIKSHAPTSKWKSFHAALKSIWRASHVKAMQQKLQEYRSQLTL